MLDMLIQGGRVVTPAGVGDWDVGVVGASLEQPHRHGTEAACTRDQSVEVGLRYPGDAQARTAIVSSHGPSAGEQRPYRLSIRFPVLTMARRLFSNRLDRQPFDAREVSAVAREEDGAVAEGGSSDQDVEIGNDVSRAT